MKKGPMSMSRNWRLISIASVAALLALLTPMAAAGAGLSVGPPQIEYSEAQRGEEYEETIYIKHINEGERLIEVSVDGGVSEWVTFYTLDDPATPIESMLAPAGEWQYILVRIQVPDDAPAGDLSGKVTVRSAPPDGDGGGTTVGLTSKVDIAISVVGGGGWAGSSLTYVVIGIVAGAVLLTLVAAVVVTKNRKRRRYARVRRGVPHRA